MPLLTAYTTAQAQRHISFPPSVWFKLDSETCSRYQNMENLWLMLRHAYFCPRGAWCLLSSRERKTQWCFKGYGRRVLQQQGATKESAHHTYTQPGLASRSQGDLKSRTEIHFPHQDKHMLLSNSQGKSLSSTAGCTLANLCPEGVSAFEGAGGLIMWWQTTSEIACLKLLW